MQSLSFAAAVLPAVGINPAAWTTKSPRGAGAAVATTIAGSLNFLAIIL